MKNFIPIADVYKALGTFAVAPLKALNCRLVLLANPSLAFHFEGITDRTLVDIGHIQKCDLRDVTASCAAHFDGRFS